MAAFGEKYMVYAPIKEEPKGQLPVYGETVMDLGGMVKADLTINYASGEGYADDTLSEKIEEFISGTIAAEVNEMSDEVAAGVFGARMNENGEKIDNSGDSAPCGGLAYYKCLSKNSKKFWRGYFYPKVRAAMGNDSANTKANSITMTYTPITFTVNEPETGDWRYVKSFDREQDVIAWIDRKLANEPEPVPEEGEEPPESQNPSEPQEPAESQDFGTE